MKHKAKIAISNGSKKTQLLTGDSIKIPMRLLRWLLGDFCEILVLTPGKTVQSIEIQEVHEGVDFSG